MSKIAEKEEFCGACAAGIVALAGAGLAGSSTGSKNKHKQKKKIIFWSGVSIIIIAALVAVYFLFIKKCDECA